MNSQLLKGILEGCVLAIIAQHETYGYEITQWLERYGFGAVSEGTIYPLLLRLQKEELIRGEVRPSASGPNRKYYTITEKGQTAIIQFKRSWEQVNVPVQRLFFQDGDS